MSDIRDIVDKISRITIAKLTRIPSPGPLRTSAAPSSPTPSPPDSPTVASSSVVASIPTQPDIPLNFEDNQWLGDKASIKFNHSSGIPLRYQVSNGRNYKNYVLDSNGKEIRLKADDVVTIYPAWFLVETSDGQRGYIRSKYIHYI